MSATRGASGRVCLMAFATGLSACGGGQSSDGSATPAPVPAPPPGTYLTVVRTPAQQIKVLDPAHVTPDRLLVEYAAGDPEGQLPHLVSTAHGIDFPDGTRRYAGTPLLYYVKGGRVMEVDLLAAKEATTAKAISSITDACRLLGLHPLDSLGRDLWIAVATRGADGLCDTADDRSAVVRSGSDASTAPEVLPLSVTLREEHLTDTRGQLMWLLADDSEGGRRTVTYSPTLVRGPVVGDVPLARFLSPDPAAAQSAYVEASDATLRQLSWTDTSVSLSESIFAFTGFPPLHPRAGAADAEAFYFLADDTIFVRRPGEAPKPFSTDSSFRFTRSLVVLPSGVLVEADDAFTHNSIFYWTHVIPKPGGGNPRLVARGTGGIFFPRGSSGYRGHVGDSVYYAEAGALRRVNADGSGDEILASDVGWAGVVFKANETRFGDRELHSVLICRPGTFAIAEECLQSDLSRYDVATGRESSLGRLAVADAQFKFFSRIEGTEGFPLLLRVGSLGQGDQELLLSPGTDGSAFLRLWP